MTVEPIRRAQLRRPTAVVVDDSSTMRRFLRIGLEEAGVTVLGEGSAGDEVLDLYLQHRPTLMFLDIVLPGKDGVEAARELMERNPEAIVVMSSSLSSRDRVLASKEAGAARYLLKPFTHEKLSALVRELLGSPDTASAESAPAQCA